VTITNSPVIPASPVFPASLVIPASRVIPAKAGIQMAPERGTGRIWIPAFAGMTGRMYG
jgi:hypothetical protein